MTKTPIASGVIASLRRHVPVALPNEANGAARNPFMVPLPNGSNGASAHPGDRHRHQTVVTVAIRGAALPRATTAGPAIRLRAALQPCAGRSASW